MAGPELQNDSLAAEYATMMSTWTTSGKVLAGIDSLSHDSETVRARLATALRRRVPCCGLS